MFDMDTWKELTINASDVSLLFTYSIYNDMINEDPYPSKIFIEKREALNAEIKRRGLTGKASQL